MQDQYKSIMAAVSMTLSAFAAAALLLPGTRRCQYIYISFPQGAQQQTHHTPLLWSIDVMDKQTVHIRPLQRPCSRCYADSLCKFSLTH